jgi:hypothetical protein
MARLGGACAGVRPSPTIRSLAIEKEKWATKCSAPIHPRVGREATGRENGLFLVQFDAEEELGGRCMAFSWRAGP